MEPTFNVTADRTVYLPTDPLAEWTFRVKARNGAELCVRPLREDDRVREIAFINSLSERTRYLRMMSPLRYLSPHLLDQLMEIDYHARMAFVASVERDGVEEFVGIARYGPTTHDGEVELGVTVTDAWQRQGVARLLIGHLMRFAAWRGFRRMCGFVLPENSRMLALAHSLGFDVRYDDQERQMHICRALRA